MRARFADFARPDGAMRNNAYSCKSSQSWRVIPAWAWDSSHAWRGSARALFYRAISARAGYGCKARRYRARNRERAVLILHSSGRAAVNRRGLIHGNPNAISHGALR